MREEFSSNKIGIYHHSTTEREMEEESVRQRKGRGDQDSLIEKGDMGERRIE